MKLLIFWSIGNYGEGHDNIIKAIWSFLTHWLKINGKIRFQIKMIKKVKDPKTG